jgi:hypothetical protein
MVRTQIYLTREEHSRLRSLARRSGRKQSELIREAIDAFLERTQIRHQKQRMQKCRGIWKDRDLSEFEAIRREVSRRAAR